MQGDRTMLNSVFNRNTDFIALSGPLSLVPLAGPVKPAVRRRALSLSLNPLCLAELLLGIRLPQPRIEPSKTGPFPTLGSVGLSPGIAPDLVRDPRPASCLLTHGYGFSVLPDPWRLESSFLINPLSSHLQTQAFPAKLHSQSHLVIIYALTPFFVGLPSYHRHWFTCYLSDFCQKSFFFFLSDFFFSLSQLSFFFIYIWSSNYPRGK